MFARILSCRKARPNGPRHHQLLQLTRVRSHTAVQAGGWSESWRPPSRLHGGTKARENAPARPRRSCTPIIELEVPPCATNVFTSLLATALAAALSLPAHAERKDSFSVCWTIYAGWMPWEYAARPGYRRRSGPKKYGIEIDVVQVNDYVESINQYTAGQFDGCSMTNMDALTIPPPPAWTPPR